MPEALPSRKYTRLDPSLYAVPGRICSITIVVKDRSQAFLNPALAAAAIATLRTHAAATGVDVFAYCLMPDHAHLLLGPSPTCDVITFVGQFKNLSQRAAWEVGWQGQLWQRSFWDRFLRTDEDLHSAVEYILANPVRAQLVQAWRDYPYAGSLRFDL